MPDGPVLWGNQYPTVQTISTEDKVVTPLPEGDIDSAKIEGPPPTRKGRNVIWTKEFWKGAAERGIKTFFQTSVAVIGAASVGIELPGLDVVNWLDVASVSGLAAVLSLATSLGNADFTAGTEKPVVKPTDS